MSTFTPPSIAEVSPLSVASSRDGASTAVENRWGTRLFRYFSSRQRGVTVFKMSDGTYRMARAVTGLSVTVAEPYPPVPEFSQNGDSGVVNDALATSWYAGAETVYPLGSPTVSLVYYGGRSYSVSSAEAASLVAAGFGSYVT